MEIVVDSEIVRTHFFEVCDVVIAPCCVGWHGFFDVWTTASVASSMDVSAVSLSALT